MNRYTTVLLGCFLVALSILFTAKIGSDTILRLKLSGDLSVKGFAKKTVQSDLGKFDVTLVTEGPDLKTCYGLLLDSKQKLAAYLERSGFTQSEFNFGAANIEEKYFIHPRGHALNKIEKYVLSQPLFIESSDVAKVERLSSNIVELLNEGVRLLIGQPQYYCSKLDDMKAQMVGLATENAKTRAGVIATKGGFRLGTIREVRVGIFQITPVNSNDVSDSGINDNSSIQKEIKSVVEINYYLK